MSWNKYNLILMLVSFVCKSAMTQVPPPPDCRTYDREYSLFGNKSIVVGDTAKIVSVNPDEIAIGTAKILTGTLTFKRGSNTIPSSFIANPSIKKLVVNKDVCIHFVRVLDKKVQKKIRRIFFNKQNIFSRRPFIAYVTGKNAWPKANAFKGKKLTESAKSCGSGTGIPPTARMSLLINQNGDIVHTTEDGTLEYKEEYEYDTRRSANRARNVVK